MLPLKLISIHFDVFTQGQNVFFTTLMVSNDTKCRRLKFLYLQEITLIEQYKDVKLLERLLLKFSFN